MSIKQEKEVAKRSEPVFTKEQLLNSKHFEGQDRDWLAVLMEDEVILPIEEAKRLIAAHKAKEVK